MDDIIYEMESDTLYSESIYMHLLSLSNAMDCMFKISIETDDYSTSGLYWNRGEVSCTI